MRELDLPDIPVRFRAMPCSFFPFLPQDPRDLVCFFFPLLSVVTTLSLGSPCPQTESRCIIFFSSFFVVLLLFLNENTVTLFISKTLILITITMITVEMEKALTNHSKGQIFMVPDLEA